MKFPASLTAYEAFLHAELGPEIVEEGLAEKRAKMADGAFAFLRATYWRWAEIVPELAPALMDAPRVLAVGDIHLANYGTWRDADGRLVWGVNDYDEAAEMPWALDPLRLVASALLTGGNRDAAGIAAAVIEGYRAGLAEPKPAVLERGNAALRGAVMVPEAERAAFWEKLAKKRRRFEKADPKSRPVLPPRYVAALHAALPRGAGEPAIWYRSAGLGSLGRPRWVAEADRRGEVVIREAKGVVPSAWTRRDGGGPRAIRCAEIASGRFRAPDPWYRVTDGVAVRRLSPNSRKVDIEGEEGIGLDVALGADMLRAMGAELAAVHLGTGDARDAIAKDLDRRPKGWLAEAAKTAASTVAAEHADYAGKR